MRLVIILLIFCPFISFSQINQIDGNGLKQGLWQKKQSNGRLLYEGHFKDDKPIGEWKRYHGGGQLKALIVYKNDTAHTELYDVWQKKIAEGNFVNKKKEGVWKTFKENRIITDEAYKGGIKDGVSHRYYDTGELMEEQYWVNGFADGKCQVFFKNGKPYMQYKMAQGKRNGIFISLYKSGLQEIKGEYKNNLRDGEWKYYDKNGDYLYSYFYCNGKIQNPGFRDSIESLNMQKEEGAKGSITDPEKFMQDPTGYMMQTR